MWEGDRVGRGGVSEIMGDCYGVWEGIEWGGEGLGR